MLSSSLAFVVFYLALLVSAAPGLGQRLSLARVVTSCTVPNTVALTFVGFSSIDDERSANVLLGRWSVRLYVSPPKFHLPVNLTFF